MEEMFNAIDNARHIKEKLERVDNICEVYDIVNELDIKTLKLVLKLYVYEYPKNEVIE